MTLKNIEKIMGKNPFKEYFSNLCNEVNSITTYCARYSQEDCKKTCSYYVEKTEKFKRWMILIIW